MQKVLNDVSAYIAQAPKEAQAKLRQLRAIIKATAPQAKEYMGYGMPAYDYKGKLAYFGGYKKHIGFYPLPATIHANINALKAYKTSKGAIQFPLDKPLPVTLIKRLLAFRMKENNAKAKAAKK
jgi:uncharacterized protein YdhG (YjbR/CyaY superfamily)